MNLWEVNSATVFSRVCVCVSKKSSRNKLKPLRKLLQPSSVIVLKRLVLAVGSLVTLKETVQRLPKKPSHLHLPSMQKRRTFCDSVLISVDIDGKPHALNPRNSAQQRHRVVKHIAAPQLPKIRIPGWDPNQMSFVIPTAIPQRPHFTSPRGML